MANPDLGSSAINDTPEERNYRLTVSIPVSMYRNLAYIHKRLGYSISSILTHVAEDGVEMLAQCVAEIPASPGKADLKRARGRSEALITGKLNELYAMMYGDKVQK